MRVPTSKKYVAEQVIVMPNWSKTFQAVRSHSPVFVLEKQHLSLNFERFFTSKDPLVATSDETSAPTSRKYIAEHGILKPNW